MGSQAVWHSPSEKLDSCFQVLSSSCRCPLHHCPSWKCLASLLLSLRQWLLPRSNGFLRFHTSYCLMWNPALLEGGSHGTFSKTNKRTRSSWQRHSRYDFTGFVKKMCYSIVLDYKLAHVDVTLPVRHICLAMDISNERLRTVASLSEKLRFLLSMLL